jgi:hypothetical protein
VSRDAKGDMHNAHSGPPVGCDGGEGVPLGLCQDSCIGVRGVQSPVSSCSVHQKCGPGTVVFKRQRKSRSTSLLLDRLFLSSTSCILTEWNIGTHRAGLAT